MNHRLIITALSLLALLSLGAQACPDGPHGKMFESLGLSEEQETALKALHQSKRERFHNRRENHDNIQQLLDEGEVEAAADIAAENARENVRARAEFQRQLAAILTPEQLEQWKANKQYKHGHFKKQHKMKFE